MSAATQDILYGVSSQILYYDAPEGKPSSVTSVSVYENTDGDDDTAEVATTGSASVSTTGDTTVDVVSGSGETDPRVINLTSTAGVVMGTPYLMTNLFYETEWILPRHINLGPNVEIEAKHPLANRYQATSTFETTRIQISVLDSWAADDNNISGLSHSTGRYRVRWVYVDLNSVTRVADTYFDLVRYPGNTDITPLDVDAHIPGWLNRLPDADRETQGRDLIATAYNQLKVRLVADGKADQLIRDTETMGYLVALKADEVMAYGNYRAGGDLEQMEMSRDRFASEYHAIVGPVPRLLEAATTSGAASNPGPNKMWRR